METTPAASLGQATPCIELDVRTLIAHLIGTAMRGLATAKTNPHKDIPFAVTGVADHALAGDYAALIPQIRSAWAPLTHDQEVTAPWGRCTALQAAQGFTVETVTHGWDLAVATGRESDAPAGVAERCLVFAEKVVPDRLRGVMYNDAVPSGETASPTEQLANLLGHRRP